MQEKICWMFFGNWRGIMTWQAESDNVSSDHSFIYFGDRIAISYDLTEVNWSISELRSPASFPQRFYQVVTSRLKRSDLLSRL